MIVRCITVFECCGMNDVVPGLAAALDFASPLAGVQFRHCFAVNTKRYLLEAFEIRTGSESRLL